GFSARLPSKMPKGLCWQQAVRRLTPYCLILTQNPPAAGKRRAHRAAAVQASGASAAVSVFAAPPSSTTLPPAASTAAIADFDAPATSIVIAAVSFPFANSRMPSPWRRSTPAATPAPLRPVLRARIVPDLVELHRLAILTPADTNPSVGPRPTVPIVIPGLRPGDPRQLLVDGRGKPGHDDGRKGLS